MDNHIDLDIHTDFTSIIMTSDHHRPHHHKPWRGLFLGEVSNSLAGISGAMFAVDERTVYLADYTNVGDDSSEFIGCKIGVLWFQLIVHSLLLCFYLKRKLENPPGHFLVGVSHLDHHAIA